MAIGGDMEQEMRIFGLKINLPFLPEGAEYAFDDETSFVYRVDGGNVNEFPLRTGLASYLWLLRTEGEKYLIER